MNKLNNIYNKKAVEKNIKVIGFKKGYLDSLKSKIVKKNYSLKCHKKNNK